MENYAEKILKLLGLEDKVKIGETPNNEAFRLICEKVNSLYLVKFKSKFDDKDKLVAKNDLREFIESLRTNHRFRYIQFCACASNPACKLYDSWIEEFGGYKHKYEKSIKLKDGKYYDSYDYVIYCERWED